MQTTFNQRHLLGIRELDPAQITDLLDTAESFREISKREIKKVPALRGRTVINLFFEPSTRTRTSFEIAAKRLSADAVNVSVSTSSVSKGETLLDTARNLEAMSPDCIVIRHSMAGAPQRLARMCNASIVNAGDGAHEHPTQALLDALTIREHKGKIEGLKVAILGDILHSRVARSNIYLLTKLGATVSVSGPATLAPKEFGEIVESGLKIEKRFEEAIEGADVVMVLRIQRERQDAADHRPERKASHELAVELLRRSRNPDKRPAGHVHGDGRARARPERRVAVLTSRPCRRTNQGPVPRNRALPRRGVSAR